jgi:hypothetical protein
MIPRVTGGVAAVGKETQFLWLSHANRQSPEANDIRGSLAARSAFASRCAPLLRSKQLAFGSKLGTELSYLTSAIHCAILSESPPGVPNQMSNPIFWIGSRNRPAHIPTT